MSILSFMVPTNLFPSLSAWESGGTAGTPEILLGRDWEVRGAVAGAAEGQRSRVNQAQVNLGFSKPALTWEVVDRLNTVSHA